MWCSRQEVRSQITKHNLSLRSDSTKCSRPRRAGPEGSRLASFASWRELQTATTQILSHLGRPICAGDVWLSELFLSRYDIKMAIEKLASFLK